MFPHPHDALPLSLRPNLDQYKKLAKDLLKAAHSPDPTAFYTWAADWIKSLLRHSTAASHNSSVILSEVAASRSEAATQSKDPIPAGSTTSPKGSFLDGQNLRRQTTPLENFAREKLSETPTLTSAQFVIARAHGFESWPKLAKHVEATARANSPINRFEQAADAIVAGDFATLAQLLKKNSGLIRAHSTRRHQATLLHYTAANGIEDYRQKTPPNIVEIAKLLLDSGAEVNAVADLYGGSTTLTLAATSVHPERAGVQNALLQLLLDRGATIDPPSSPTLLINSCLANGRGAAAEFLANHGAKLDLEAAAGIGRLDAVRTFFTPTSNSTTKATKQPKEKSEREEKQPEKENLKKQRALLWACEYGHNPVVDFLLDQGVPIQSQANTGQTPLHWAVIGRQRETVELLLARGADPEAKNAYEGTALGQAQWSAAHSDNPDPYLEIAAQLKRHAAKPE